VRYAWTLRYYAIVVRAAHVYSKLYNRKMGRIALPRFSESLRTDLPPDPLLNHQGASYLTGGSPQGIHLEGGVAHRRYIGVLLDRQYTLNK